MSNVTKLLAAAIITGFAHGATAQVFGGDTAADEFEDLMEDIEDDAESNAFDFGNVGREVGTYGSIALRATMVDAATDTTSVGIGAQYGFFDGVNGSEFNLAYAYADKDGVVETDTLAASYDYTRDFSDVFFGYANVNVKWDNDPALLATDVQRDAFVGFGVGYRVVNTATTQFAVKAGPGYRFFETVAGDQTDEAAYSVEANYSQAINETVSLSNDTTLIGSSALSTLTNELALTVAMSNALSLRTSYVSVLEGADLGALDSKSNTLGVAVVYNFN